MKAIEVRKSDQERIDSGFYKKYMCGEGLDIGYKGLGLPSDIEPVLPNALGIDLDTPGYDGIKLPFENKSKDFVFSSHCLEHISDYVSALKEWHRVLKEDGFLIVIVPNCFLYERSFYLPGPWGSCDDHKRAYTPARLLREIEESLKPNSYRVELLTDNDKNFIYDRDLTVHPDFFGECFEIVCVLRKIKKPDWEVS